MPGHAAHPFFADLLGGRVPGRRVARALALLAGAMGGWPLARIVRPGQQALPSFSGSLHAWVGTGLPLAVIAWRRRAKLAGPRLCEPRPARAANSQGLRAR